MIQNCVPRVRYFIIRSRIGVKWSFGLYNTGIGVGGLTIRRRGTTEGSRSCRTVTNAGDEERRRWPVTAPRGNAVCDLRVPLVPCLSTERRTVCQMLRNPVGLFLEYLFSPGAIAFFCSPLGLVNLNREVLKDNKYASLQHKIMLF